MLVERLERSRRVYEPGRETYLWKIGIIFLDLVFILRSKKRHRALGLLGGRQRMARLWEGLAV